MTKLVNLFALCLLLSSCGSLTPPSEINTYKSAASLSNWSITGAIAAKNQRKSFSAMMQWQQSGPDHFTLRLYGPLSGGSVLIEKHGARIVYQDGQRTIQSSHPEQLILTETGVNIPVNHLYYWLRGIKAPQSAHTQQLNSQGQLNVLEQDGFKIIFNAYTVVGNLMLPSKIDITHPEGRVRIVIKQWLIN